MSDKNSDPTANTAAFQAFAEKADTEQARSKSGLIAFVVAVAVLVVAAAVAYVVLS